MNECLNGRLVQVSQIRCALSWFLSQHERLWIDESESIDDNFTLYGLDRIYHYSNSSGRQLFEGLLCIDINGREPATESRM